MMSLLYLQVKVTSRHTEEAKRLLSLMGIPYVNVCTNVIK